MSAYVAVSPCLAIFFSPPPLELAYHMRYFHARGRVIAAAFAAAAAIRYEKAQSAKRGASASEMKDEPCC